MLALWNRLPSPAAFLLLGVAIVASALLATELTYRAALSGTPGSLRMMFSAPDNIYPSPIFIDGPSYDRLEQAIVVAYWSKPEMLPKLREFMIDASKFYEEADGKWGARIDSRYATNSPFKQAERKLLERREAHLADLAGVVRINVSRADPVKDADTLSPDERKLLQITHAIAQALIVTDNAIYKSPAQTNQFMAALAQASKRIDEMKDVYANPAISTATLRLAFEEAFRSPLEVVQARLRDILIRISKAYVFPKTQVYRIHLI